MVLGLMALVVLSSAMVRGTHSGDARSGVGHTWCHWCPGGGGDNGGHVYDKVDHEQRAKTFGYCEGGPDEEWSHKVREGKPALQWFSRATLSSAVGFPLTPPSLHSFIEDNKIGSISKNALRGLRSLTHLCVSPQPSPPP